MTDEISLDEFGASYGRLSKTIVRALEDAYDFLAETVIAALERDQRILNAAFFILIFGQLERRINLLAERQM